MNKSIIFFLPFLILFFTSCSQKTTALNHFESNPQSAYLIQYTKKRDILYKNDFKSMFFATYLNKSYKKFKDDNKESFIVGIHIVNKENHDLIENAYKLKINNIEIKKLQKLDRDSDLIKKIPLKNPWANYYLVTVKSNKDVYKLNLTLSHATFGQVQLSFDK